MCYRRVGAIRRRRQWRCSLSKWPHHWQSASPVDCGCFRPSRFSRGPAACPDCVHVCRPALPPTNTADLRPLFGLSCRPRGTTAGPSCRRCARWPQLQQSAAPRLRRCIRRWTYRSSVVTPLDAGLQFCLRQPSYETVAAAISGAGSRLMMIDVTSGCWLRLRLKTIHARCLCCSQSIKGIGLISRIGHTSGPKIATGAPEDRTILHLSFTNFLGEIFVGEW